MNIETILSSQRTHANIRASSKKRAIEEAASRIADNLNGLTAEDIYNCLIAREKLGTTAIGEGIAIPHCRLEGCNEIVGSLFSLQQPVDFEAFDNIGVNLMFIIIVPCEEVDEHLQILGMLAQAFESAPFREQLRQASTSEQLYERAIAR